MFKGAEGPSPDDADGLHDPHDPDHLGNLFWVVEVRSRPYGMKPWKARWKHLKAHGVLSMEVLCVDERMQLSTVNDTWCYGVEFVFDADREQGSRTRVKLTPDCAAGTAPAWPRACPPTCSGKSTQPSLWTSCTRTKKLTRPRPLA